jgi:type II secretory pathway component GspD/PulD (secretin)
VAGVHTTGTGVTARTITYRQVGTNVVVTPRVAPENVVALELKLDDQRAHVAEDAPVLGFDDNKNPIRATQFVTTMAESKVTVAAGLAVLVQGVKVTAKDPKVQTLVIVSARVLGDGKGK